MGREARHMAEVKAAAPVRDRLGRALKVGDVVTITTPHPPLMQIMALRPQLDPTKDPGTIVEVMCPLRFFVHRSHGVLDAAMMVQEAPETPEGQPRAPRPPALEELVPPPPKPWWQKMIDRAVRR